MLIWKIVLTITAQKVSVFGVIPVRIFLHSDWTRRDTEYISIFSPNEGKCGPEYFRIRSLFTQYISHWSRNILANLLKGHRSLFHISGFTYFFPIKESKDKRKGETVTKMWKSSASVISQILLGKSFSLRKK